MAELTAKSPCDGLLPVTVGALKLSPAEVGISQICAIDIRMSEDTARQITLPENCRTQVSVIQVNSLQVYSFKSQAV